MPFSSITDDERLTAVKNAYERAWAAIEARGLEFLTAKEAERERLAYIIAGFARSHPHEDLVKLSIDKFLATALVKPPGSGSADRV